VVIRPRHRADFFFTVTSWEVRSLRHFHRVVEDNLTELLQRYGVQENQELSEGERVKAELELNFVEARVPALLRVPILTMCWSLYEACVVEVSQFFETRLSLTYSVATSPEVMPAELNRKWRKWTTIRKAEHFFREQLQISLVSDGQDRRKLDDLRILRNVLAHAGGRRPLTGRNWARLEAIAERDDELDVSTGFVVATADYVRAQIDLVSRTAGHVVTEARRIVTERRLYD